MWKHLKRKKLSKQLFNVGFKKRNLGKGKKKTKSKTLQNKSLFRQASFPFLSISKIFMNSAAMVWYPRCNQKLLCRAEAFEKYTVTLQCFTENPRNLHCKALSLIVATLLHKFPGEGAMIFTFCIAIRKKTPRGGSWLPLGLRILCSPEGRRKH